MKKNHRFWLLALALSLLLTCAACGKKTVSYAHGNAGADHGHQEERHS